MQKWRWFHDTNSFRLLMLGERQRMRSMQMFVWSTSHISQGGRNCQAGTGVVSSDGMWRWCCVLYLRLSAECRDEPRSHCWPSLPMVTTNLGRGAPCLMMTAIGIKLFFALLCCSFSSILNHFSWLFISDSWWEHLLMSLLENPTE